MMNSANPDWTGHPIELELPSNFNDEASLKLRVMIVDDDLKKADDAIGSAEIEIEVALVSGSLHKLAAQGAKGPFSISFDWEVPRPVTFALSFDWTVPPTELPASWEALATGKSVSQLPKRKTLGPRYAFAQFRLPPPLPLPLPPHITTYTRPPTTHAAHERVNNRAGVHQLSKGGASRWSSRSTDRRVARSS